MYAKNPATSVVAISSASEMKFWCIKDAIDSPSTIRTATPLDTNREKTLIPRRESTTPHRPKTIGRAGGKPVDTQNQVLAIMKYQFFWKQAYQRTGSQRYSNNTGGNGFNTNGVASLSHLFRHWRALPQSNAF